jgi:rod shape-determining protein MreC
MVEKRGNMKLNNKKKRLETRYIVIIAIIGLTIFIGLSSFIINDKRNLTPIEGTAKDIIILLQRIVYAPFRFIDNSIRNYNDMKRVYKKYKDIDNLDSKSKLIEEENKELKKEINNMKLLLDLNNTLTDYNIINATIVNRDVGDWFNTLTLDKGTSSGIKKDMAVITDKGLIGRVIKTTSFTSEVKLITTNDINSKISVSINSKDHTTYGILSGYDAINNTLLIDGIIDDINIKRGDSVTTSGLSNLFTKGIIIGTVDSVISSEYGISRTIRVKPCATFNDIRYASVVLKKRSD